MDIERVKGIIAEMKKKKLDVAEEIADIATPTNVATDDMIYETERNIGIKLPDTYKIFLKEYANGNIYLYGVEPMVSVGLEMKNCLCKMRRQDEFFHSNTCLLYTSCFVSLYKIFSPSNPRVTVGWYRNRLDNGSICCPWQT